MILTIIGNIKYFVSSFLIYMINIADIKLFNISNDNQYIII